jgi:hypothetical protein
MWIIVRTFHGLLEEPELFFDRVTAFKRFSELKRSVNADYDEIEMFEKHLRIGIH